MTSPIYFDESLPAFALLVQQEWGNAALNENFFLRDVTGLLTFVVLNEKYSAEQRNELAVKAIEKLVVYVDKNGFAVATPDELFDERLKDTNSARKHSLSSDIFSGDVLLVDRRMVGADWLRDIAPAAKPPIRIVFSSIKGGVGRSTALCVAAAHLAAQGRRVLAIDMDLEAPGLGNMLLPDGTLPKFGLLDYLVESGLLPVDDDFYVDLVASSWLGGGKGRVDVVPAIGQSSLNNPANVLAKIARAYLDGGVQVGSDHGSEGLSSFMDRMRALIDRLADPYSYDVVLIDARAGLHETTATAVVGLGAEVLFFGLDQPQTFAGYELLFAHLAEFQSVVDSDWYSRINFVQAKASNIVAQKDIFAQKIGDLATRYFLPPVQVVNTDLASLKDSFDVEWADIPESETILVGDDSKLPICAILNDSRFNEFNPLADRDSLVERVYSATYGDFLAAIVTMVDNSLDIN